MSDISHRSGHHFTPERGHLAWRVAGVASLVLAVVIQVWLAGRLGPPAQHEAVIFDYLGVMASFVFSLAGIGLVVLGRDARQLLRDED